MYSCPGCGGMMTFDIPSRMLKCSQCGRAESIAEADGYEARTADSSFAVEELSCPNCGAVINTINTAAAGFCSYCGSSVMLKRKNTEMNPPESIAPFRVTREQCFQKYQSLVKKSLCADRRLKREVTAESFRGIYVPYYVYSAMVEGETVLEGKAYSKGDTYYYNSRVKLNHRFSHILHDASREMPDALSEKISRLGKEDFKPFSPAYLSGFYADVPDMKTTAYVPFAKAEGVRLGVTDVIGQLDDRISYSADAAEKRLLNMAKAKQTGTVLVPVWFMSIRSGKRLLYAVQNGVTGEMAADLPMDIPRFGLMALLCAVPLFFLFNAFLTLRPELVMILAMLLTLIAQWIVNRHRSAVRQREELETVPDANGSVEQRIRLRKQIASQSAGKGGKSWLLAAFLLAACGFGLYKLSQVNLPEFVSLISLVMTALMALMLRRKAGNGLRAPNGCYAAWILMLLGTVNLIWNPFHSADEPVYLITLALMAAVIWVGVEMVMLYNRECSNPLPQFESHQGGDQDA